MAQASRLRSPRKPKATILTTTYQPPKPLWHFGWRGYCLLPILFALIWVAWSGYDLRYAILVLVDRTLGHEYLFSFTSHWLIWHALALLDIATNRPTVPPLFPSFYLALPVLIALAVHPRFPKSRWPVAVIAYCLVAPPFIHGGQIWIRSALSIDPSLPWTWTTWEIPLNPLSILANLCLLWMTLRLLRTPIHAGYRVCAIVLIVVAMTWCSLWDMTIHTLVLGSGQSTSPWTFDGPLDLSLRLAWHLAWLALWLTWSIRARLHHLPPHACQHCAYDLRGLPPSATLCPECGQPTSLSRQIAQAALASNEKTGEPHGPPVQNPKSNQTVPTPADPT